ncbi:MAG: HAMP domain-containing histidine kinase [Bacteroidetes bacterium]|nr:HAMP domain-containing histidine kinase [Bacteroidota bacterium]
MTKQQLDKRLDDIIGMVESIAAMDFSRRLPLGNTADSIDAVSVGLNMLCEELEANVVERSRLEEINDSLERFAASAAHDMKSPLIVSISLAELLKDELKDYKDEKVLEYLELLLATNLRMNKMITGILEYSRISFAKIKPQQVDMVKLCKEIATSYSTIKQVSITIDDKMPIVMHYETALTQIISNLVDNAIKFNDQETCEIEIHSADNGDHYEISVTDNGRGILPENREKIFDLFENLKSEKKNSIGIGLATVKKIVTETKGKIWVEATEDQGAKFIFTIDKRYFTNNGKK